MWGEKEGNLKLVSAIDLFFFMFSLLLGSYYILTSGFEVRSQILAFDLKFCLKGYNTNSATYNWLLFLSFMGCLH